MLSELPDPDEDVSFVVDNGASTGPIPLREIVESIRLGERASGVLVWWAGATDWIRFDMHDDLISLLDDAEFAADLRGDEDAGTPVNEDGSLDEVPEEEQAGGAFRWRTPAAAAADLAQYEELAVAEPEPEPEFVVDVDPPVEEPLPAHAVESVEPVEAEATEAEATEAEATEPETESASENPEGFSFLLPTRPATEADDVRSQPALTGLFSAGARVDAGLSPEAAAPSSEAIDAIMAARISLESVGARIEALSSATRRSVSPEVIQAAAESDLADAESSVDESEPVLVSAAVDTVSIEPAAAEISADDSAATSFPAGDTSAVEAAPDNIASTDAVDDVPVASSGSWHAVADTTEAVEGTPAADVIQSETIASHVADRLLLTERFEEMVRKSVTHQRRIEWVMRVDELLLSACITAIADSGFVAMDLTSRDSDHRVLFEHNSDSRHVRLDLAPVELKSDHIGRHVRFGLSWGRVVADVEVALETIRKEAVDGDVPPGVLTCSADMSNSVVSTHVELILAADDLVKDDYSVDRPALDSSIAATLHALEERWKLLFTAA